MDSRCAALCLALSLALAPSALAQEYGPPDRGAPGDEAIQAWLAARAQAIERGLAEDLASREQLEANRGRYREEYLHMLGLWPLPERTPLAATVTGALEGEGYLVEKLHYQSRPRLYVTANLYRPRERKIGERLPAVLYVCGHSGMGRNGNKAAFQSHGIWFARHGYVCLVVDTLQLGEIAAFHHGTYREGRWWWHSRGYTPAGVECWNGVRGIDLLSAREDVDPARIAVTGISGGGAASFWIAAADERVRCAVPVSGMADLSSYVANRVINGHCDCMFLHNAFAWPWTRIAALVAPRPLLFVNSDKDAIFPMDANERIANALERLYALYGAGDRFDTLVSIGGHDYRADIRRGAYRFINSHLRGDSREVLDSEVDLVEGRGAQARYPIAPEKLRAFATDADLPKDELNTTIDEHFVPLAKLAVPAAADFGRWRRVLLGELRWVVFRSLPEKVAPARRVAEGDEAGWIETEPGVRVRLLPGLKGGAGAARPRLAIVILENAAAASSPEPSAEDLAQSWARRLGGAWDGIYLLEPRGAGASAWTRTNPPNYVERCHVLLGTTADSGRVLDAIAAAGALSDERGGEAEVFLAGSGSAATIAIYAAALSERIAGVALSEVPLSHREPRAAQFLNVLRVCDVPEAIGLLAPRPLWLGAGDAQRLGKAREIYAAAGAEAAVRMLLSE